MNHFGQQVHRMRKQLGYSLQDLSARSGVSRSMLSKVERGEKNPTLQLACQIAEGLGVTLSRLLGEEEERDVIIIRPADRLVYRDDASGMERHLLSPAFPAKGVEFLLNVLPQGSRSGVFPRHRRGVREYLFVLAGDLAVTLGDRPYQLSAGDAMYFEADVEHAFANCGEGECRYLLVIDSSSAREEL